MFRLENMQGAREEERRLGLQSCMALREMLLVLCDVGGDKQEHWVKPEGSSLHSLKAVPCGWRRPAWSTLPGCEVVSSLLPEGLQAFQSQPGLLLETFNT